MSCTELKKNIVLQLQRNFLLLFPCDTEFLTSFAKGILGLCCISKCWDNCKVFVMNKTKDDEGVSDSSFIHISAILWFCVILQLLY